MCRRTTSAEEEEEGGHDVKVESIQMSCLYWRSRKRSLPFIRPASSLVASGTKHIMESGNCGQYCDRVLQYVYIDSLVRWPQSKCQVFIHAETHILERLQYCMHLRYPISIKSSNSSMSLT